MQNTPVHVWPTINYGDAPAAIEFLTRVFGFWTSLVVPNDYDPVVIEHAQ